MSEDAIVEVVDNAVEVFAGTAAAGEVITAAVAVEAAEREAGDNALGTRAGAIEDEMLTARGGQPSLAAAIALLATLASPPLTGNPTAPTQAAGNNSTRIANTAFVAAALAALVDSSPAALDTLNELAAALGDDPNFATTITNALAAKAPLASPPLTGNPTAPTQAAGNNSTRIANTAFVTAALAALVDSSPAALDTLNELAAALGDDPNFATTMTNALAAKAPLDSAPLTGNPTAPTQAPGNNSTRLANTAFVTAALAALVDSSPAALDTLNELAAALGDDPNFATTMTNALAAKAPLDSAPLTGNPTAPTQAAGNNSTRLANTAFVAAALAALVDSSPAALDTLNELAAALGDDPNFATTMTSALAAKAPLDSPHLIGTPTAPTPAVGDDSTRISTTESTIAQILATRLDQLAEPAEDISMAGLAIDDLAETDALDAAVSNRRLTSRLADSQFEDYADDGWQGEFAVVDPAGKIVGASGHAAYNKDFAGSSLDNYADDGWQGEFAVVDPAGKIVGAFGKAKPNPAIEALADRIGVSIDDDGELRRALVYPERLRQTNQRLATLDYDATGQLVIAVLGDSWSWERNWWIGRFVDDMQARYGDAGIGWFGFVWRPAGQIYFNGSARADATITYDGAWAATYTTGSNGPDLGKIQSSAAGDKITLGIPAGHDAARLFYVAGGSIKYRIDGGSWTTLALAGSGNVFSDLAGIPATAFTLEIQVVSGTVALCGVDFRSSNPGVRVHKLSAHGSRMEQWNDADATQWQANIAALGVHCFGLLFGTNDQIARTAPEIEGDHDELLSRIAAAAPVADILSITAPENALGRALPMTSIAAAMRRSAVEAGAAHLDLQYSWGPEPAEYATAGPRPLLNTDNVHPAPFTGGPFIAREITKAMGA